MTKVSPFGSYVIIEPFRYQFKEVPEWWWDIRPPTAGDELALTRYINQGKVTAAQGGITHEGAPTWMDVIFFEVSTLFAGTNIPANPDKPVAEGGAPFITVGTAQGIIAERLGKMPWEMVAEIADAISEFVPGWGPKNPLSRAKQEEVKEQEKASPDSSKS